MVPEGLGFPHRWRRAEATALTGFQSAMVRSHAGHVLGRHHGVGYEGQGEQDEQAHRLGRLGTLADQAQTGTSPAHGVGEEQGDAEPGHDREGAGIGPPSDGQTGQGHDGRAHGRGEDIRDRTTGQDGRPPHGKGAESVNDTGGEVGTQPHRRAHGRGGQVQHEQPGDGEVGVVAPTGQDDAGPEDVDEQQGEQHRLNGDVGELQGLPPDVHQVPPGQDHDVAPGRGHLVAEARSGGRVVVATGVGIVTVMAVPPPVREPIPRRPSFRPADCRSGRRTTSSSDG